MLFAACSVDATEPDDPFPGDDLGGGKEDSPGMGWTGVGLGVEYQRVNTGNAILIAYGGYSARLSYSAAWASELVDAKLGALGVGQIYAVQGPRDPGYDAREIGNSKLRTHLARIDDGTPPIYVVAHSSGSYVAHELLEQLHAAGNTAVLSRIAYADLDGGGSGLTTEIVDTLRHVTFVYARDPALSDGYSQNASTAMVLQSSYCCSRSDRNSSTRDVLK